MPLPRWNWWARKVLSPLHRGPDPLLAGYDAGETSADLIQDAGLRAALSGLVLNGWALDTETLNYLWNNLMLERPKSIVEAGSGVSTIALSYYLRYQGLSGPVLSIEQSATVLMCVHERLSARNLSGLCSLVHVPVAAGGGYDFRICEHPLRPAVPVDWVLIDGPAGPDMCRLGVLPFLTRFCRVGARWFMDDCYRDGEISVLEHWSRLPGVCVEGIIPVGKGLGTGTVTDPNGFFRDARP